jgi:glycosyltransferase involved in cell wall biosynthesis
MPIVSIVLPTYNRAHLIKRAIGSLLQQTYQDFEIIIIDDASTDNTETIVDSFNDPRIRYLRHEINRGLSTARNTAIKISKGKYLAFQDDDDVWTSDKLQRQMGVFNSEKNTVGVVYSGLFRIKNGKKYYELPPKKVKRNGYVYKETFFDLPIYIVTAVIRKSCFNKVGLFDESLPSYEDKDLFIRLAKHFEFRLIEAPLVTSWVSSDSLTKNTTFLKQSTEILLKKHQEGYNSDKKALSKRLFRVGHSLCMGDHYRDGIQYMGKAIILNPYNLKARAGIFLSLFGEPIYKKVVKLKNSFGFFALG